MPRGKPFICWLSTPGNYRDVALRIGDEVEYESQSDGWVLGKIGRERKGGWYVVRWNKNWEHVFSTLSLRPVQKGGD